MDNKILERIKGHQGFCMALFNLFLVALIVYVATAAQNNIKQNKYIGQEVERVNTITVSGEGEVSARPDLALVSFSVVKEAKTVDEAIESNVLSMNAVIEFLKGQGIEEKDLKTTRFNIYPRYDYYEREFSIYPEGKRVLVGYEVSQTLNVKIREMEKIGDILQGAADAGANQVGDLSFTIDEQDELKKEAREEAIAEAKKKAKELASELGVSLVRIIGFSEGGGRSRDYGLEKAEAVGMGGAPQIETGENEIKVNVSITYEIN